MSYIDADDNEKMRKFFSQYERYDPRLLEIVFNIHEYTFEKITIDKGSFLEFIYEAYKIAAYDGMNKALDMAIEAIENEKKPRKLLEEEIEVLAEKYLERFIEGLSTSK